MSTNSESKSTNAKPKRRALGKGLGALLPTKKSSPAERPMRAKPSGTMAPPTSAPKTSAPAARATQPEAKQTKTSSPPAATPLAQTLKSQKAPLEAAAKQGNYFKVAVEDIHPSPEQPRRVFTAEKLGELAQSIKEHGVIQPLIVRKRALGGYFLIAGERRWRACQKAGVLDIPVVVQSVTEKEAFERAIVENVQRDDLNVIEEAEAYQRLMGDHGLTQDEVANRVGKNRSTVANTLRLLKLPTSVREMVENDSISMGHARALLSLESSQDILRIAKKTKAEKLSVRQVEKIIKDIKKGAYPSKSAPAPKMKSAAVRDLENRLTKALGAQVLVQSNKKNSGGKIEVNYADLDDLDRLIDTFTGYKRNQS